MKSKPHKLEFDFIPGDLVMIDGCNQTKAVVTCCKYRGGVQLYEVEWMSGGMQTCTVEQWRLQPWAG